MVTEFDAIPTLVGILILVIPSMMLGRICKHFGISEIIGFVIGGIILGPFALGGLISFFDRPLVELSDLMLSFWQIAGIIILFFCYIISPFLVFSFFYVLYVFYK